MTKTVTRVGPSPTGDPHIGTAYVALLNYLLAKKNDGKFILRIEDTDQNRITPGSDLEIINAVKWLGLALDEGPDVGGENGPYYQSERGDIYADFGAKLLENGHAFKCFCSVERLNSMRAEQRQNKLPPKYDGRCLRLSLAEKNQLDSAGAPFVIRQKIPDFGDIVVVDGGPREDIVFNASNIDMQVLVKEDGMPTYHLANVVDDHLMGVSHVLRGEEWLSSAPKHKLLYDAFGWQMPTLIHLPLLRNPDRSKLSKRKNPTSINYYRRMGYLPEALLSYLFTLTISVSKDEEDQVFTLDEMVERFDLSKLSISGPIFDTAKLDWVNAKFIREKLSVGEFQSRLQDWAINSEFMTPIAAMSQSRIKRLSDVSAVAAHFLSGRLGLSKCEILDGKVGSENLRKFLFHSLEKFEKLPSWDSLEIQSCLREAAQEVPDEFKKLMRHTFIVISGSPVSLPLFHSMELLGKDISRARFRDALNVLGKPTKREKESWMSTLKRRRRNTRDER